MKLSNTVAILAAAALVTAFSWSPVDARAERPRGDRSRTEAPQQRGERAERGERPERGQWAERQARGEGAVERAQERRTERTPPAAAVSPGAMTAVSGEDPIEAAARPYMRPFWQNERISSALELSEEQLATLKESHEKMSGELRETFRPPVRILNSIQEQLNSDSADLETILESVDRLAENRAQRHRAILTHVVNVKNTLSKEQEDRLRGLAERIAQGSEARPDMPERPRPQMTRMSPEVRQEIGVMVRDGATPDEIREYLEEAGISRDEINRMVEGVREMRQNRGEGADNPRMRERMERRVQPRD
ncbi:MAG: hypothetical protein JJU11_14250 [Candidatus Sumerlaeia bacterium]|nr:hypothetical protein [Candidatus Sumerlaeia bacterium]